MSDEQRLATNGYEQAELAARISQLLLDFYDKTGLKVKTITVIDETMPNGNVPGFYVRLECKK